MWSPFKVTQISYTKIRNSSHHWMCGIRYTLPAWGMCIGIYILNDYDIGKHKLYEEGEYFWYQADGSRRRRKTSKRYWSMNLPSATTYRDTQSTMRCATRSRSSLSNGRYDISGHESRCPMGVVIWFSSRWHVLAGQPYLPTFHANCTK